MAPLKPKTSEPHPEHVVYPYLLRGLSIGRVNQVWATDITYIPMKAGFVYLVAIMDWYSRRVLSWRLSNTLDTNFCVEALEERLLRGSASRRSSTPTRGRSSPPRTSPSHCATAASPSAWTARAAASTTSSSSGSGARSSTRRSTCTPMTTRPRREPLRTKSSLTAPGQLDATHRASRVRASWSFPARRRSCPLLFATMHSCVVGSTAADDAAAKKALDAMASRSALPRKAALLEDLLVGRGVDDVGRIATRPKYHLMELRGMWSDTCARRPGGKLRVRRHARGRRGRCRWWRGARDRQVGGCDSRQVRRMLRLPGERRLRHPCRESGALGRACAATTGLLPEPAVDDELCDAERRIPTPPARTPSATTAPSAMAPAAVRERPGLPDPPVRETGCAVACPAATSRDGAVSTKSEGRVRFGTDGGTVSFGAVVIGLPVLS